VLSNGREPRMKKMDITNLAYSYIKGLTYKILERNRIRNFTKQIA